MRCNIYDETSFRNLSFQIWDLHRKIVAQCTRKILAAHELFKMKSRWYEVASMLAADEM